MNCQACGHPEALMQHGLIGPKVAILCIPCLQAWTATLIKDYQPLTAKYHVAAGKFAAISNGWPRFSGMVGNEEAEVAEFQELEAALLAVWDTWLTDRRVAVEARRALKANEEEEEEKKSDD